MHLFQDRRGLSSHGLIAAAILSKPICPACGCIDVYDPSTRLRCKCAACHPLPGSRLQSNPPKGASSA
jgi:hypothetical protein